jgi:hypothetical protein
MWFYKTVDFNLVLQFLENKRGHLFTIRQYIAILLENFVLFLIYIWILELT